MARKVKTYVAHFHPSNVTRNHACEHRLSAQEIADAFVKQYYEALRDTPEKTFQFYTDKSVMSRPTGAAGPLRSVTKVKGIHKEIMGSYLKKEVVTVLNVHGEDTIGDSVIVVVVGLLNTNTNTNTNTVKRFTQTFFLAPQKEGFYVKNDIFHFLIPNDTEGHPVLVEDKGTSTDDLDAFNQVTKDSSYMEKAVLLDEPNKISATPIATSVSDTEKNVKKVTYASIVAKLSSTPSRKAMVSTKRDAQSRLPPISVKDTSTESAPKILEKDDKDKSNDREDNIDSKKAEVEKNAPPDTEEVVKKESYASILAKEPIPPASRAVLKDTSSDKGKGIVAATPEESSSNIQPYVKTVFIKDLPPYTTRKVLTAAVKKFGPVKHKNIHLRKYADGYRYGFVEFNHPNAAQLAVQAGCIKFDDYWESQVEFKKDHIEGAEGHDGSGSEEAW